MGFWSRFHSWVAQPFPGGTQMDATSWALFLGFALVILMLWHGVIRHITESISEEL